MVFQAKSWPKQEAVGSKTNLNRRLLSSEAILPSINIK